MMLLKSFFRRIIKDFRHKELLPLKMIFFVQASTLYVLYPYLTIHMRELGINVEETAIMSAVTPVIAMVMPPLAGMLADRIGNFKILLSLFSSFGGVAALLLLLVPIGRITVQFPERVVMDLSCAENDRLVYSMDQKHPCQENLAPVVATRLESCGYMCHLDIEDEFDERAVLSSRYYTIRKYDVEKNASSGTTFKFAIARDAVMPDDNARLMEDRKLKNNEHFRTSVRQLTKGHYFFPADNLYELSCTDSPFVEYSEGVALRNSSSSKIGQSQTHCMFASIVNPKDNSSAKANYHSYASRLKRLDIAEGDLKATRRRYLARQLEWTGNTFRETTCDNPALIEEGIALNVPLFNESQGSDPYKFLAAEGCTKRCILTAPREQICSNKNMEIEYNVSLTFWLYLAIRVFIGIIGGTTFAMFEGAVIAILREQKADYGLQRIYGTIGGMISSPLSGLLIDYASSGKSYTDFRPAFYLYAALKLVSGVLMLGINLEFKAPASNVVRDLFTVLKNVEAAALFIACFVLGTAWGYIESFLFWLIQDLGGSRSLMGITITVGGIAGIPLLVLSGPIISKIGHANVLFIGFVFYAIRLCGYSLIYNPWLTLIFEALESVTSSLSFTAAVTYAAKLSTTTTDSSIQGLLGGVYYGVGKGSGSLIGGYLMKAFGTRPTYQIFAVVSLVTGIIYFLFNVTYLRRRPQVEGNDIVKKKPKKLEGQNGLDAGFIEIGLDEKKRPEAGVRNGDLAGENEVASVERQREGAASMSLEAAKNARNLDKIERMPLEEATRTSSLTKRTRTSNQRESEKARPNGLANPSYEEEEGGECAVTIESRPRGKK
ncbi:hypothetical protein KM043_007775 [Ampulex compressa]|nr:hypothetical protein KM043_007775 [Ampulex compressa]